jgi:hypothetical protein
MEIVAFVVIINDYFIMYSWVIIWSLSTKKMILYTILIGGMEHFLFFRILGIIIPTDFYFFSEGLKPPTRKR